MIELSGQFENILKELRQLLSGVDGVRSIKEDLTISYVAEVADESKVENVEKVAAVLAGQSEKYGFIIEVTPATTAEIEKAKQLYAEHIAAETKFKA